MSTWGALRPTETVPLTFFAPPHASSGLQHRVQRSGPLNPSGGITGQGVPPEPPWARPPKPGGLGWNWSLGKTAHFTGTEALPFVIPHRGTKLGTLAQRWGMGGRVVEPITHTRTGSKTKGNSNFSSSPCGCECSNSIPSACGVMPEAEGTTPRPQGGESSEQSQNPNCCVAIGLSGGSSGALSHECDALIPNIPIPFWSKPQMQSQTPELPRQTQKPET